MVSLILLVAALILFVLAAFGVAGGRFNLVAGGLACWVLSVLLQGSSILRTVAIVGALTLFCSCAGTGEGGAWTAADTTATVNALGQTYDTGSRVYRDIRSGYATQPIYPAPVYTAPVYAP
jgi:hypothetical protein